MHGLISATHGRRQRASARRHFRHGWRAAANRAFTGARLYIDKKAPSLVRAAEDCGSNVNYVRAAIAVLKDGSLNEQALVLTGHLSLLEAANQARLRRKIPVDEAVLAWRSWTPEQRSAFGRDVGIAELWDNAIIPVMTEERGEAKRIVGEVVS
jgi:hypothetical protein